MFYKHFNSDKYSVNFTQVFRVKSCMSFCKVFHILTKSRQTLVNFTGIDLHLYPKNVSRFDTCGQTDKHDETKESIFRRFY